MSRVEQSMDPLVAEEGWYVLHQFYEIDYGVWGELSREQKLRSRQELGQKIKEIRLLGKVQVLLFSVVGRADFGYMMIAPDLHLLDKAEKEVMKSSMPGLLKRSYSFLSLTEESEYKTSEEEYRAALAAEGFGPGTVESDEKVRNWTERTAKYREERVYPVLGDWKVLCFYPMAKRRDQGQNWYGLAYEERRRLMVGHAAVGRKFTGKVKQLITGATGLSDWEWGVTLFSNDPSLFKSIVYEMRFDEVSHKYGLFGPFYIGIILEIDQWMDRILGLDK